MMAVEFRVKHLVDAKGWSISDFMHETRLSYPTALKLYHGQARRVDLEILGKVLNALGATVQDVFISTNENESKS